MNPTRRVLLAGAAGAPHLVCATVQSGRRRHRRVRLWRDPLFLAALRHNGLMLLVVPLAMIALALFFAATTRGTRVYRVVYFFP